MRKSVLKIAILVFATISMSGCQKKDSTNTESVPSIKKEDNAEKTIEKMESKAVEKKTSVSVPTAVGEDGEFKDFIDVTVEEAFVEKDMIKKVSLDPLKTAPDLYVDTKGNLKDNYIFIAVKLSIDSKYDVDVYTTSFILNGVKDKKIEGAACFYQDGETISSNPKEAGIAKIYKDKKTEITMGFFAEDSFLENKEYYLQPMFFDTDKEQDNYISITLNEEN